MSLALRELVRVRGRFLTVGAALTLIAVLVLLLGGLLDGLTRGATGLLRAQDGQLIVFSDDARDTIDRSALTGAQLDAIAEVESVIDVAPFGAVTATALPANDRDEANGNEHLVAVTVVGYSTATGPVEAPRGDGATADDGIGEDGIEIGDTLALPGEVEVTVHATVRDVAFGGAPTLWVPLETYRSVVRAARPDTRIEDDGANVAAVRIADEAELAAAATAIDDAVDGVRVLTVDEAIGALPGLDQQEATFLAIIVATLAVAGLVVGLFFALLTLERAPLYAVLKALGASTAELARGVALQATLVALGACAVGGVLSIGLAALVPDSVPVQLLPGRAAVAVIGFVITAVLGSAVSLRRLARIEPAEAIG